MKLEIVVLPAAAADLAEAHTWYEAQQEGLGAQFLDAVDRTLKLVASRPNGFPIILSDARKALVPRFPIRSTIAPALGKSAYLRSSISIAIRASGSNV